MDKELDSYKSVVRGGLKLKKDIKKRKPKKEVVETAPAKVDEQTEDPPVGNEQPMPMTSLEVAEERLTNSEKAFRLAQKKREQQRVVERLKLTHRERMDKLNLHLASLSEHFDIPKVGPGKQKDYFNMHFEDKWELVLNWSDSLHSDWLIWDLVELWTLQPTTSILERIIDGLLSLNRSQLIRWLLTKLLVEIPFLPVKSHQEVMQYCTAKLHDINSTGSMAVPSDIIEKFDQLLMNSLSDENRIARPPVVGDPHKYLEAIARAQEALDAGHLDSADDLLRKAHLQFSVVAKTTDQHSSKRIGAQLSDHRKRFLDAAVRYMDLCACLPAGLAQDAARRSAAVCAFFMPMEALGQHVALRLLEGTLPAGGEGTRTIAKCRDRKLLKAEDFAVMQSMCEARHLEAWETAPGSAMFSTLRRAFAEKVLRSVATTHRNIPYAELRRLFLSEGAEDDDLLRETVAAAEGTYLDNVAQVVRFEHHAHTSTPHTALHGAAALLDLRAACT